MKQLLLRRIPLMALVCTIPCLTALLPEAGAMPPGAVFFQQNTPLKTVLNQISRHYKVNLLFEESLVQSKNTNYKFVVTKDPISKVLYQLLTPLGLKATRVDEQYYAITAIRKQRVTQVYPLERQDYRQDTIILRGTGGAPVSIQTVPVPERNEYLLTPGALRLLRGRVVSDDRENPVPGATVMALTSLAVSRNPTNAVPAGRKYVVSTDAEGYYTIHVPLHMRSLVITHVNFSPDYQAIPATGNDFTVLSRLKSRSNTLSEVVVTTGLFKRSKENFTGASNTISGEQLRAVNNVNVLDALKVFDPSVRIPDDVQFGSDPNRLPTITLRGTNNFPQQTAASGTPGSGADYTANYVNNPNQPLFILDGFEVSLQKIYDLDINRIATFTILKDAAATSIYGSRAANGVIVIDTKQPLAGRLRLSYSGMTQITAPDLTVYDLANAEEKLEVERLAGLYSTYASGIRPDADAVLRQTYANRQAAVKRGVNTYWLSQPVRTGIGQRHSIYMEGGDMYLRYGLDLSFNNVAGVMKNSDRSTYSGGVNISYRYKGILFKNTLSVGFNKAKQSNYGSFADYTRLNQYWSPYDSAGKISRVLETVRSALGGQTVYYNPLYNTTINTINQSEYTNILNQTNIDWLIGNGFRLSGRIQITKQHDQGDVFLPAAHTNFEGIADITKRGSYMRRTEKFFSYDGSLQLDYSKQFGKHQVFSSTGAGLTETNAESMGVYVEGFPNDRLDQISFGNGYPPNSRPTYNGNVTRLVSGYANVNYSYDNRYNLDLSFRTDGSSQFGENKRFGTFWSAGASWNLHKEKMFAKGGVVNRLRVRGSIGITGSNKFQPFMGITTYSFYTDQNYRGLIGASLLGFGNTDLQWQQTLKENVGIDLGIWNDLVAINVDVYRENTTNLIVDVTTPPSVGFGTYKQNIGELENRGIEFRVNAFILRNEKKRVYWSIYVNGLHNQDFIRKISNSLSKRNETNNKGDQTLPQLRYEEGESVNGIWAVQSAGIDPSTGREVFIKRDGTLNYNWDANDKVIVGNTVPELRGSFGTNLTWKGLTLGLYFSYEFGGQLYNQTLIDRVETTNYTYNVDRRVLLGRWTKPGDVTYFKGLVDENGRTVTTATQATSRFVQTNNFINAESISLGYSLPEKLNKRIGVTNTRINCTVNDIRRWSSIEVERGIQYPFARNFTINLSTTF